MKNTFIILFLSFCFVGIYSQNETKGAINTETINNTETSNTVVVNKTEGNLNVTKSDTNSTANDSQVISTGKINEAIEKPGQITNNTISNKSAEEAIKEANDIKSEAVNGTKGSEKVSAIIKKAVERVEANKSDEIKNLEKMKDFNLTLEMEKIYTESIYESVEDKFVTDAEQVKNIKPENEYYKETEEDRLRKEWEDQVSNFVASDILTVKLKGKSYFNFFEDITEVPSLIRVAYFVNGENVPLDFSVFNPKQKLVHKTKSKGQIFHEFIADKAGMYKFILDNSKWTDIKKVSLAIHTGNNTDFKVDKENIDTISKKINIVNLKLNELQLKEKLLLKKLEGHYEKTQVHNKQIVKYSVVECVTMVIILFVQLYYLKHLLKKVR